ncbi:MAG: beta-ketoacyl synthase [Acidimicrobiaceae bacterium]|nr:beta-ketoacyl synthase [Acidimicrobiaceae bacterium]|tara:strand:- start:601 stop:1776 length:1176 start_codon:yes stop_codon:yes gene_type:complete
MDKRRVAVTGLGVVSSCGVGLDSFWDGLCASPTIGERRVTDFDPEPHFDSPKEVRRSDLCTQFAIAAADMAFENSGRPDLDPYRMGVMLGTGIGGISTLEDQMRVMIEKGGRRVSPFLIPMMMANAAPAAISMKYNLCGPAENVCTACAAGTHAITNAARLIATGRCDLMVAGGSEAAFTEIAVSGFTNMTAFSSSGISRPFDAERDGFVMGEGAGVMILEDFETAVNRGAVIYAEVLGGASTADAHHITAPSPGGSGAINCMRLALEDAELTPDQIGHINAHGTSTPLNDMAEAQAMAEVFDAPGPLVTSTKGITGHALGAAGALEAVAVVLAIQKGLIPPTAGFSSPDPEMPSINLVTGEPREWTASPAMSNSFGFGGHNGSVIIGPAE